MHSSAAPIRFAQFVFRRRLGSMEIRVFLDVFLMFPERAAAEAAVLTSDRFAPRVGDTRRGAVRILHFRPASDAECGKLEIDVHDLLQRTPYDLVVRDRMGGQASNTITLNRRVDFLGQFVRFHSVATRPLEVPFVPANYTGRTSLVDATPADPEKMPRIQELRSIDDEAGRT
jgi:hypothetical protein